MNSTSTFRLLLVAAALLARTPGAAHAQDSLAVYLPVLEHVRERYPGSPVYLYSSRLRMECVRGGCDGPRVGALPDEWLVGVRGQGLVSETCRFDRGLCVRPDGRPVLDLRGAYTMLGTSRGCGEDCIETLAEVTAGEETGTIRRTTLYRLMRAGGKWQVQSTTPLAWAVID